MRTSDAQTLIALAHPGLGWTPSRKHLELLLNQEQATSLQDQVLQTHEQRLASRLMRLNLDMLVVPGDGNCQFRSVSNELFGTQIYHQQVRQKAVKHIRANEAEYGCFLGEDFHEYLTEMSLSGTWGDELTLRAVCDSYGMVIRVVTSDEHHWYLTYEPTEQKVEREIFITYIAPIHYNSVKRHSSLRAMTVKVSSSFRRMGSSLSFKEPRTSAHTHTDRPSFVPGQLFSLPSSADSISDLQTHLSANGHQNHQQGEQRQPQQQQQQ
ncbi:MAG: hypothetical protein WDW38_003562 [Sanguina aurantia]